MLSRNKSWGLLFPALFFIIPLILFNICIGFPALSAAQPKTEGREIRILLGFKQPPSLGELTELRVAVEGCLSSPSKGEEPELVLPDVARINLSEVFDLIHLKDILRSLPFTSFVEEDGIVSMSKSPNDSRYLEQWHLPSISAPQAWDVTTGSAQVTIAVIDTGVDYNHSDLAGKCVAGYNFVARNSNPMDDHGHGTHVAGIAAAASNNSVGVAGVDWGVRIMPLKVLDSQGSGYDSDLAAAIHYAADRGVKVINMSLGSSEDSYTLNEAVNYAYNKGVTMVSAAGNESSSVSYPAACDHVIAVGALDSNNNLTNFSNRGPALDLTAPGVSILSTFPGGYQKMSGTSMASPVVAGCASLVLGEHPEYIPSQVESVLENSATDLGSPGFDTSFGYGKVNAYAAVCSGQPAPNPSPGPGGPQPGNDPWNPPSPGGQPVWYLAEGYTGTGFQTYVLVQNPNADMASIKAEFVNSSGGYIVEYYSLSGYSRLTLNLNTIFPNDEVSTCISSTNQVGIVVERSVYFNSNGRNDGHSTQGSTGISTNWYFAEGYTGPGFDEYVLVLNPWFSNNNIQLTLFYIGGGKQSYDYLLAPASRLTIHVNDLAPGKDVAARITSTNGVVAER